MKDFNQHVWLDDTVELIKENLSDANESDFEERFNTILEQEIDTAVIYYSDAVAIILALGVFSGYEDSEFFPFTNISQIAYAGLYEWAHERISPVWVDDLKGVTIKMEN